MMKTKIEDQDYVYNFIKDICDKYGPRPPCSQAELNAIKDIGDQLSRIGCDEVFYDDFYCHPGAYPQGFVKIPFICLIMCLGLYPILPIIVPILTIFSLLVFFIEFPMMKEFIDPLFKKERSQNVFGKINSNKETRKLVIIGGHVDSANVFPLFQKTRRSILKYVFGTIGIWVVFMIISIITLFAPFNPFMLGLFSWVSIGPFPIYFNIFWLIFLGTFPFMAYVLLNTQFFTNPVMGANDNLSGTAIAMGVANWILKNNKKYDYIELWCGAFGAEEAGQRGSKAFVKKYGDELKILKNAYALIPESVGVADIIGFISAEQMHFVEHSKELVTRFEEAYKACLVMIALSGEKFCKMGVSAQDFAGTDAMRFSEKKYEAIAFIGADKDDHWPLCYHSLEDNPKNIRSAPMRYLIEVILVFLDKLDKDLAKY
ncbi:MAG: M28 family peptidase [Candidatus Lokiarchaeota archaeon]|nr:M28 family peptidase [Candidatus Lokiarchaeota archaeon]